MDNTVTLPPDETSTDRLLAAVEEIGPVWLAMGKGLSAKKARSGSTPFDQSAAGA